MRLLKKWIAWDGFLTKEGRVLDPKEWHSFSLGLIDGFRDIPLLEAWDSNRENMHHKLEFQYFKIGWTIGKRIPQRPVMFLIGLISGLGLSELLNVVNF